MFKYLVNEENGLQMIHCMFFLGVKRRAGKDTPSMPPRPYQVTPRHSMKTPRKKLALFSPASSMKKKRCEICQSFDYFCILNSHK